MLYVPKSVLICCSSWRNLTHYQQTVQLPPADTMPSFLSLGRGQGEAGARDPEVTTSVTRPHLIKETEKCSIFWSGHVPALLGGSVNDKHTNTSLYWTSLVAQTVKNPPAIQETQVRSLGREDPLEEGMTTHSSILAWRIPWTEEPGGLQSTGSQRIGHDWATNTPTHYYGRRRGWI